MYMYIENKKYIYGVNNHGNIYIGIIICSKYKKLMITATIIMLVVVDLYHKGTKDAYLIKSDAKSLR